MKAKPILVTIQAGEVRLHTPCIHVGMTPNNAIVLATGLIEAALQVREQNEEYAKHVVQELLESAGFKTE